MPAPAVQWRVWRALGDVAVNPLPFPCLSLVTDRKLCRDLQLEEKVSLAIEGGVNLVQLREKDLPGGELLRLAERLRDITRGRAFFFVNERLDVALACGADGVHLGEEALPARVARKLAGDRLLIGRSVHSLASARRAEEEGADFLQVGTIFETTSKPGVAPAGISLLKEVKEGVRIPVIAIGGIKASNAALVMKTGVHGVAVISAILAAHDPRAAAQELCQAVEANVLEEGRVQRG